MASVYNISTLAMFCCMITFYSHLLDFNMNGIVEQSSVSTCMVNVSEAHLMDLLSNW